MVNFGRRYYGELFCRFYGSQHWEEYLNKASSLPLQRQSEDYRFDNGEVLSVNELNSTQPGSCEREFVILLTSEIIYKWCSVCGLDVKMGMSTVNTGRDLNFSKDPFISVDVKSTGCKFPMNDIKTFLGTKGDDIELAEHCWSLSNSCGEMIDPSDISRFKAITFRSDSESKSEAVTSSRVIDYLSHCLSIVDMVSLPSQKGEKRMLDKVFEKYLTYLGSSTLVTNGCCDNPLMKGVVFDFVRENAAYLSTYANNIKNFSIFSATYMPVIEDTWHFKWNETPPDFRLLFDFTLTDLTDKSLPLLNVNDMQVVLGSQVKYVENVLMDVDILSMRDYIYALMKKSNSWADESTLWAAFHCYYGTYRTAISRVVSRPLLYVPPPQLTTRVIDFSTVENLFDTLQKRKPDTNIRRQFCGKLGVEAIACFKALKLSFPKICTLNVPLEYGYLNIDYYKHIPGRNLSDEERLILCNIKDSVNEMCLNRALSTEKRNAQRHPKLLPNKNSFRDRDSEHKRTLSVSKNGLDALRRRLYCSTGGTERRL
ncbi:CPh [Mint virus 1]|uniref:CPh n=1 Tax=Mint virus 1 TaxID=300740 RepID=Q5G7G3_9CLOS|nr:CPh [Mint virus 1]AAW32896.1 CPh [Mint virus 1]